MLRDGAAIGCRIATLKSWRSAATHPAPPGFDKPVPKGQIICSCPITQAKPGADAQGYQILGPYPCDKSFFRYCKGNTANSKTGSTIYVGAPIGTAQALAVLLHGKVPPINECRE
jgi:hypothetical protein